MNYFTYLCNDNKISKHKIFNIMQDYCNCPLSASLPDVGNESCPVNFGQIQKLAFQRLTDDAGAKNGFSLSKNSPEKIASWQAFLSAEDSTKIIVTPTTGNVENEAGAPIEFGGGNETADGIVIIVGREPTSMTGSFYRVDQSIIKALKELNCENNLGVYLLTAGKGIVGVKDESGETTFMRPIPVKQFWVEDLTSGGLEGVDTNNWQMYLQPNWSDDIFKVVAEDFVPLTDLKNVSAVVTPPDPKP